MALGTAERVLVEVDGRQVVLHLLELGLACCGIEVRAGRRLAGAAGQLVGGDPPAADPVADLPAGPQAEPGSATAGSPPRSGSAEHHSTLGSATAGREPAASHSEELNLLVVAGTVTARLAPAVRAAWEALPEPRAVLAFGACTATGGPYWDSYAVVPGAHELVPVDVWVPGCPPRPQELVDGIREVLRGRS